MASQWSEYADEIAPTTVLLVGFVLLVFPRTRDVGARVRTPAVRRCVVVLRVVAAVNTNGVPHAYAGERAVTRPIVAAFYKSARSNAR